MLALTFADPADYDKIRPDDKVDILGLESFAPGKSLTLAVKHADGTKEVSIMVRTRRRRDSDADGHLGNPARSFIQRGTDRVV
ncbi:Aconitate hydratase, mitochondrial [Leucoagaricus sp. SymC.cos]|nr:Aconitate hydratase, mitochondrial [Leucoagaricus sp. SymC.cos]